MCNAFKELLDIEAVLRDGKPLMSSQKAGDGVAVLNSLIHWGKGLSSSSTEQRREVLFFSVQPKYDEEHYIFDPLSAPSLICELAKLKLVV